MNMPIDHHCSGRDLFYRSEHIVSCPPNEKTFISIMYNRRGFNTRDASPRQNTTPRKRKPRLLSGVGYSGHCRSVTGSRYRGDAVTSDRRHGSNRAAGRSSEGHTPLGVQPHRLAGSKPVAVVAVRSKPAQGPHKPVEVLHTPVPVRHKQDRKPPPRQPRRRRLRQ
jgi:hypothetical protein